MHIIVFTPSDSQAPQLRLDETAHRVVRERGRLEQLLQLVGRLPDIVIVAGFEPSIALLEQIERLCAALPATSVVLHCAQPQPDFLIQAMRSGVREVISTDEPKLLADVVARLDARHKTGKMTGTVAAEVGRCIGLMSAKGGDGGTCLAANLAVEIARGSELRVLLLDLSLPFGDVEMFLTRDEPAHDLADFCAEVNRLDAALLEVMAHHLTPNLHLITAPPSFDKLVSVAPEHVERLVRIARRHYDFVIIDLGAGVDPISLRVLETLDLLAVVLTLTVPSVRRAGQMLRLCEKLDVADAKVALVVNKYTGKGDIQQSEFEKAMGKPVSRLIAAEVDGVNESLLKGEATTALRPRADFTRAIVAWAAELSGRQIREKSLWRRFGIK